MANRDTEPGGQVALDTAIECSPKNQPRSAADEFRPRPSERRRPVRTAAKTCPIAGSFGRRSKLKTSHILRARVRTARRPTVDPGRDHPYERCHSIRVTQLGYVWSAKSGHAAKSGPIWPEPAPSVEHSLPMSNVASASRNPGEREVEQTSGNPREPLVPTPLPTASRGHGIDSGQDSRKPSVSPLLDTRHLATLCAVASERSFRRAASSLGYTQSAVSQHMAALERRIGTRLIERSRAGVTAPTPAGEVLIRHAQDILARLRVAHADLQPASTATVCVATSPGPAPALAAELVTQLNATGTLRATWQETNSGAEVAEAIAAGDAELGVGQLQDLEHPALRAIAVLSAPLYFVWNQQSCSIDRFTLPALDERPLTAYRTCSASQAALTSLHLMGIAPSPLVLTDDGAVINAMLGDRAFALVPGELFPTRSPHAAVRSAFTPAQLAIVRHRDRQAASELLEIVSQVLRNRPSHLPGSGSTFTQIERVADAPLPD